MANRRTGLMACHKCGNDYDKNCGLYGCPNCHGEGVEQMTPSQQAKSMGLKSLTQVSQLTGVSLNTLTNWHRHKPRLFGVVLAGCIAELGINDEVQA